MLHMANSNVADTEPDSVPAPRSTRWPRLRALGLRLKEAHALGTDVRSQFGYLTANYWSRFASHAPFDVPRLDIPVRVRANGHDVCAYVRSNGVDWSILRDMFLNREYELEPRPSNVTRIVDLGANCGFASLYFSTCFPEAEFLALEPLPDSARACRHQFARNRIRGEVIEAACAQEDGFAQLLVTGNDACHSLSPVHAWEHTIRVETVSVPTLMARKGWNRIDILKIDIEGYEKVLFQNSPPWLGAVRVIVGELHGDYGQAELARDVAPYGFSVRTLTPGRETTFVAVRED